MCRKRGRAADFGRGVPRHERRSDAVPVEELKIRHVPIAKESGRICLKMKTQTTWYSEENREGGKEYRVSVFGAGYFKKLWVKVSSRSRTNF